LEPSESPFSKLSYFPLVEIKAKVTFLSKNKKKHCKVDRQNAVLRQIKFYRKGYISKDTHGKDYKVIVRRRYDILSTF